MFTDIVTSTDLVGIIGDDAWEKLLRWHDRELRKSIAEHQGEEVQHTGDGFFVAFEHALDGVECAVDIQRAWSAIARNTGSRRTCVSDCTPPRRPVRRVTSPDAGSTSPLASAPPRARRRSSSPNRSSARWEHHDIRSRARGRSTSRASRSRWRSGPSTGACPADRASILSAGSSPFPQPVSDVRWISRLGRSARTSSSAAPSSSTSAPSAGDSGIERPDVHRRALAFSPDAPGAADDAIDEDRAEADGSLAEERRHALVGAETGPVCVAKEHVVVLREVAHWRWRLRVRPGSIRQVEELAAALVAEGARGAVGGDPRPRAARRSRTRRGCPPRSPARTPPGSGSPGVDVGLGLRTVRAKPRPS